MKLNEKVTKLLNYSSMIDALNEGKSKRVLYSKLLNDKQLVKDFNSNPYKFLSQYDIELNESLLSKIFATGQSHPKGMNGSGDDRHPGKGASEYANKDDQDHVDPNETTDDDPTDPQNTGLDSRNHLAVAQSRNQGDANEKPEDRVEINYRNDEQPTQKNSVETESGGGVPKKDNDNGKSYSAAPDDSDNAPETNNNVPSEESSDSDVLDDLEEAGVGVILAACCL